MSELSIESCPLLTGFADGWRVGDDLPGIGFAMLRPSPASALPFGQRDVRVGLAWVLVGGLLFCLKAEALVGEVALEVDENVGLELGLGGGWVRGCPRLTGDGFLVTGEKGVFWELARDSLTLEWLWGCCCVREGLMGG